jgi:uncharacterized Rmd1/YagE family protein
VYIYIDICCMEKDTEIKIVACQLAENINLKKFRADYTGELYSSSSYELFYQEGDSSWLYVLNYGLIAFAGYDDIRMSNFISLIENYCDNRIEQVYREDLIIYKQKEKALRFSYNAIYVPEINPNVIRVAMINVCQSVALDFYADASQKLLDEAFVFTNELEKFGKVRISKKDLLKFIGKSMNIKNRIFDNLYIIDSPEIVWENEYLGHINQGLSNTFDLKMRFRETEYALKIVENNLSIFTVLIQHKESKVLEVIIIALICIEVLNLFFSRLFS